VKKKITWAWQLGIGLWWYGGDDFVAGQLSAKNTICKLGLLTVLLISNRTRGYVRP